MYIDAIEIVAQFTRPIHFVRRNYESAKPFAFSATLFMVNADGWALTCKHVAQNFIGVHEVNAQHAAYVAEMAALRGKAKDKVVHKQLEAKYGYTKKSAVQALSTVVNCFEGGTGQFDIRSHPQLDLALLHFKGFTKLGVTSFPIFAQSGGDLKQGKSLCRLGFPFPEFTNFTYDATTDVLEWTATGQQATPQFPIDGIVTRHLGDGKAGVFGFEMSTPGLKGQSGGPAFDSTGRVWGMQFATNHLDLDFDIIDREVLREGLPTKVNNRPFLHVGHCIHVDTIKAFMSANGVAFAEG